MASSSSLREKRTTPFERKANPTGWINDEEIQSDFVCLWGFKELDGDYYPNLVKVFYANLRVKDSLILSRVKGVDVWIDEAIWNTIAGFHPARIKSHLGMCGINKMAIYKDCIRFPEEPRDFTLFRVGDLKRDECVCAFVIAWVILPRGGNHAQLTT
ncbi:hypothetical protein LR48_Vigan03g120800 [Vigna angularis]|uniref:Uncharacterized protein n=1 Tax=Phaseolus angularis TaxID=3914 RepID=A0A0L9U4W9_PHAAN|nr:hypothetical protein LR48_Vigan03g120800 [Vigna angularis]